MPGNAKTIEVKICGLRTAGDFDAASKAGAKFIGMVFYPPSPRHLTLAEAESLRAHAEATDSRLTRVALTVDADDKTLEAIVESAAPHMLQCHGGESPERIAAIKTRFGLPVMKAIKVQDAGSLAAAEQYEGIADRLLFDSAALMPSTNPDHAHATIPGGTGTAFDWGLLKTRPHNLPWMLAGGLTADNVAAAIAASGARAVDVTSGVESAPGVKDHAAIMRFVKAATIG